MKSKPLHFVHGEGVNTIEDRKERIMQKYKILDDAMSRQNMKAIELARKSGVHVSTLSHWKCGRYLPKIDKLKKIAQALDIPLSKFIE